MKTSSIAVESYPINFQSDSIVRQKNKVNLPSYTTMNKTYFITLNQDVEIAKEVGDKAAEGLSYCNLGFAYHDQGQFKTDIEYHKHYLEIAKEVGDKAKEGKL